MSDLIISASGLRGIVGTALTPAIAMEYASAYGTYLGGGKVLVGRDSRPSGVMLVDAVMAGLASTGCDPIDIGMAAMPTCGFLVRQLGASGGAEVTASHNPPEWNGMKLFHRDGRVLYTEEAERVRAIFSSRRFRMCRWDTVGKINRLSDPHAAHLTRILSIVDAEAIRRRAYHVVLDSNHGVGGILGSRLLSALGCRVSLLGGPPDGAFEHPLEPVPENLSSLSKAVREHQAAVGLAQDPDADRLALVDETGRPIGEEYTITLAAAHLLGRTPGTVVVNLSTTRAVERVAVSRRSKCVRVPVGEASVVKRMLQRGAVLGGEGNGGVILPQVVLVRDSFTAMAIILEAMALEDVPISQLVARMPRWSMVKRKVNVQHPKLPAALRKLANRHRTARTNRTDGLRLDWSNRWVHVRPSNTEPVARVIAEASTQREARELSDEVCRILRGKSTSARRRPARASKRKRGPKRLIKSKKSRKRSKKKSRR